jgi:hypothetical protein
LAIPLYGDEAEVHALFVKMSQKVAPLSYAGTVGKGSASLEKSRISVPEWNFPTIMKIAHLNP